MLTQRLAISPFKPVQCSASRQSRKHFTAIHCSENNANDSESRRNVLGQICLTAAAFTSLAVPQPASADFNPPGFKKDLSNKRRQAIPEELYSQGPEGLKYYDIVVGDGLEAKEGSRVAVHYDVKWRGITFRTSRMGEGVTGGSPLGIDLGSSVGKGGTLKGLDLGIRGMRVGGQRRLLVPPELAYGSKGYGEIPAGATLTIDVALLSIKTNAIGTRAKLVEG